MSEIIYTYPIDNPDEIIPMKREKFYEEQIKIGTPTKYIGLIQGLLINTKGEIIIQQRALNKNHNPGMFDKSLGGHIKYGDDLRKTILEESIQELNIPAFLARDRIDFKNTVKTNAEYLDRIAILYHVETYFTINQRKIKGKIYETGSKTSFFIGVTDTKISCNDGEVESVGFINIETLEKRLQSDTQCIYTNDLRELLKSHGAALKETISFITNLSK